MKARASIAKRRVHGRAHEEAGCFAGHLKPMLAGFLCHIYTEQQVNNNFAAGCVILHAITLQRVCG